MFHYYLKPIFKLIILEIFLFLAGSKSRFNFCLRNILNVIKTYKQCINRKWISFRNLSLHFRLLNASKNYFIRRNTIKLFIVF